MQEVADSELLWQYAEQNSEAAFAELVTRYVNLVYSAAARKTGNLHAAEEITQAVFIIFAKKAGSLRKGTVLSGWLYQTARLTAANFLRNEIRRGQREQEAYMQSLSNQTDAWPEIAPLLEDAMGRLNEKERNAIVLRFFEGRSFQEIGAAFGGSENAAKKRVIRGLEKLRKFFARRGVSSKTAIIGEQISAHSIQAAPAALVKSVTAVALAKGAAASASTLTLIKGTLKVMAWSKAKIGIVVGAAVVLTVGTATVALKGIASPAVDESLWLVNSDNLTKAPQVMIIRPTHYPRRSGSVDAGDRVIGVNMPVKALFARAYDFTFDRMILPADVARNHYDLMLTLPDHIRESLRAQIQKQLRLVVRREIRDTDVWILRTRGQLGFQTSNGGQPCSYITRAEIPSDPMILTKLVMTNASMSDLAKALENFFGKPTVDQTRLTGPYDVNFQIKTANDPARFKAVLLEKLNQLGLDLVPGHAPVEVLIVEHEK